MSLQVFPVKATKKRGKFDLYNEIKKLVKELEKLNYVNINYKKNSNIYIIFELNNNFIDNNNFSFNFNY